MMQLKTYEFEFGRFGTILDDEGHERHQRLADDEDVVQLLEDQPGETSPSEHLDQLTRAEMDRFPQLDYRQALDRVMKRNPTVVRLHASETAGRVRVVSNREDEGRNDVSALIAGKARALVTSGECKSYGEAAHKVLAKAAALRIKYAAFTSHAGYQRAG